MEEYYTISKEYQNTGIIKVRIPKIYTTISFNTTTPTLYSQDKLKKFYKYNEFKKYITLSITADNSSLTLDELATIENLIIIEPEKQEVISEEPEETDYSTKYLKELRLIFPDIKATSKEKFLEKIYDKQR